MRGKVTMKARETERELKMLCFEDGGAQTNTCR